LRTVRLIQIPINNSEWIEHHLNGYQNTTGAVHENRGPEVVFLYELFENKQCTEIRETGIRHNQKTIPDQPVMYAEAPVFRVVH